MDIAIISYYASDFKTLVTELVENEGFTSENNYVWIKESKNIPGGIKFDHVLVELGSEDMYSYADLEKLKSQIPLKHEKFETIPNSEENASTEDSGASEQLRGSQSSEDVRSSRTAHRPRKSK